MLVQILELLQQQEVIMDNFIDRLAQKFTAGEVISANSAAEERELKKQLAKERRRKNRQGKTENE